jgi:succinate dehydrogenase/fumarate reductase cytochrome b subunit
MLQKLVIIGFLVVIVYNLGSGLYYMMVDKGDSDRMVRALTWRIALSIALIALIGIGIWTGWIQPHGVGG